MDGTDFSADISLNTEHNNKKLLLAIIIKAAQNNVAEERMLEFETTLEGSYKKHIKFSEVPYMILSIMNTEIWIPSDLLADIKNLLQDNAPKLENELSYWQYYRYNGNDDSGILWILEHSPKSGDNKYVIIKNK